MTSVREVLRRLWHRPVLHAQEIGWALCVLAVAPRKSDEPKRKTR